MTTDENDTVDENNEAQPCPLIYYNQESGTYQPLDGDLTLHSLADADQLYRTQGHCEAARRSNL